MSVQLMEAVWASSKHAGPHLLMLLAVADFANADGHAWPSVATLAAKCRMTVRNAQALLAVLRESGELLVLPNEGPKGANLYVIRLPDGVKELSGVQAPSGVKESAGVKASSGVKALARGGEGFIAEGVIAPSPEPSEKRHEPQGTRPAAVNPKCTMGLEQLRAEGVEAAVAEDWLRVRKAKRAGPVTVTAWRGVRREAERAGLQPAAVVRIMAERGWQSFRAEWMRPAAQHAAATKPVTLGAEEPL